MNGTLDRSLPGFIVTTVTAATVACADANGVLMALVVARDEAAGAKHGSGVVGACAAVITCFTSLEDVATGVAPGRRSVFCILLRALGILQFV